MSEYIRRENAIDAVEFGITLASAINIETGEWTELFQRENDELREAVKRIKDIEPADVVQVVRCKDCKHFSLPHACWHDDGMVTAQEDGFCSYGERKEKKHADIDT